MMGKLSSILFEDDDGPASSLLLSGSMDEMNHVVRDDDEYEDEDDMNLHVLEHVEISESSEDPEGIMEERTTTNLKTFTTNNNDDDIDEKKVDVAVATTKTTAKKNMGAARSSLRHISNTNTTTSSSGTTTTRTTTTKTPSVRFADDVMGHPRSGSPKRTTMTSTASTIELPELNLSELAALGHGAMLIRVMEIQTKAKALQTEVEAERKLRKKKERNVVKVAQALNRRVDEIKRKDAQIVKMANFIAESKAKLSAVEEQLEKHQNAQGSSTPVTDQSLQKELLEAQAQIKRLQAQLKSAAENNTLLKSRSSYSRSSRSSATSTTSTEDAVTTRSAVLDSNNKAPSSTLDQSFYHLLLVVILTMLLVMYSGLQAWSTARTSLCSPVAPGTVLHPDSTAKRPLTMQAPYWAPTPFKGWAYSWSSCASKTSFPRLAMTWDAKTQELTLTTDASSPVRRFLAQGGVAISDATLTLYQTVPTMTKSSGDGDDDWVISYTAHDVAAPWATKRN